MSKELLTRSTRETTVAEHSAINPLEIYLSEIGKFPLLDALKERELGEKIFKARLSLRNLTAISKSFPDQIRTSLSIFPLKLAYKRFLPEQLNGDIQKILQKKEDKVTSNDKPLPNDVHENDQLIKKKIEELFTIKDDLDREKAILELVQEQTNAYHKGNQAYQSLFNSNLRLVVSIAKKHLGRGLEVLDLIQEGNEGLEKAVVKFDFRLGYKFSTYATWWIKQAIMRDIADHG